MWPKVGHPKGLSTKVSYRKDLAAVCRVRWLEGGGLAPGQKEAISIVASGWGVLCQVLKI